MAAPRPQTFGELYSDATLWETIHPDYGTLLNTLGSGNAAGPEVRAGILATTARSPVVLAIMMDNEPDTIYVVHSPTLYPRNLAAAFPMDDHVVVLAGNDANRLVPIVLPADAFARTANVRCLQVDGIRGPAGHGANPPVVRTGPHAATVADTDAFQVRRAMLLPGEDAGRALNTVPSGQYTHSAFYTTFLETPLASANAATVAKYTPLREWWRAASTNLNGGTPSVGVVPVATNTIASQMLLADWANRVRDLAMARLGHGGPGLSSAAFTTGITELRNTLENNHQAQISHDVNSRTKTFTDKHGSTLSERVCRLCSAVDDQHLPEIHELLVNAPKNREYGIIQAIINERCGISSVQLTEGTAPIATTKLVEEVFRSYQPCGAGTQFAQGLSPFAIVCEGHKEMAEVQQRIKSASLIEAGTSMTLADATTLTTRDVRFPNTPFVAIEKLYGWSVVIDVFHGAATPIATSVRKAANIIGPHLHRLSETMGDIPGAGMDLICRVLFDMQQDYFLFCSRLAAGGNPSVPTFDSLVNQIQTSRANSLSPLPVHWYSLIDAPPNSKNTRGTGVQPAGPSPRQQSGTTQVSNPRPDRRLLDRFANSGHPSITAMLGNHGGEVPKHGDKPVCLSWALRGTCSDGCKRKSVHVSYSRSTVQALHSLLDTCGVANPQN